MKRFICLLLTTVFSFSLITAVLGNTAYAKNFEVEGYSYNDLEYLQSLIAESEEKLAAAHDMAEAGRALGYDDSHEVIQLAKDEWLVYAQERDTYQNIYDKLVAKWEIKQKEYPEATEIWEYLKQAGYSDYVCAGIIGNIMTEVGGNTLDIQPLIQTPVYYGMCQWSSYYPEVWGLSVKEQCEFLVNSIEQEIITFGHLYRRGMTYEEFMVMTDCKQIALCFAKVYERCGSGSYNMRQENAVVAYNYFVS